MKAEFLRKSIHLSIALIPFAAAFDLSFTALLLMIGMLVYTMAEGMRYLGFSLPLVSGITETVLRRKEQGRFALAPLTLGFGALLSLLLFPPQIATAAIFILAFGDTAGTMVGKFLGRLRPAFLAGKSVEGSLACFLVSFTAAFLVFNDWKTSLAAASIALLLDILPLGDMDNLLMPLAVGACVSLFF